MKPDMPVLAALAAAVALGALFGLGPGLRSAAVTVFARLQSRVAYHVLGALHRVFQRDLQLDGHIVALDHGGGLPSATSTGILENRRE